MMVDECLCGVPPAVSARWTSQVAAICMSKSTEHWWEGEGRDTHGEMGIGKSYLSLRVAFAVIRS